VDYQEIVHLVNTDPVIKTLLEAPIPMRLGYLGLDGHPRTVPVVYLWNGKAFVFASRTMAYKVRAIAANPRVSFTVDTAGFPPLLMIVRGTASIEIKQGVPQEHVEAARRSVGADNMADWERSSRETTPEMAVITIIPTHIIVADYETRFPPPVEVNVLNKGAYDGARPKPESVRLDETSGSVLHV
jgi:hypothetical protein